ncbi:MAG: DUF2339 domain-containing protein [Paracoccaceae bacterium]
MMGLGILAALVVLGIPVAVIVLLVSVSGLKRRVAELEASTRLLGEHLARLPSAGHAAMPVSPPDTAPDTAPAMAPGVAPGVAPAEVPVRTEATFPATALAGTGETAMPPPADPAMPWGAPDGAAPPPPPARTPSGPSPFDRLTRWMAANWVYAVSALSLALAGVFFVQYGIENGLLTPAMRVVMAVLFGLALIAAGEFVRRRGGDGEDSVTAYLPSTFAGAGIVAIFAGLIAARQLYGLIGPEVAFAGLALTAGGAVLIGWFYGPFLAAVGLIGATAAPFAVGGQSANPEWLYGYFGLVAGLGLMIDTMRRWAWVSGLSVALGFAGGWLLFLAGTRPEWFAGYLAVLPLLAIGIPSRGLWPDHAGPGVAAAAFASGRSARVATAGGVPAAPVRPSFPTLLAAASVAAASVSFFLLPGWSEAASLSALAAPAALALVLILWTRGAPALADLAALPAAAFLARIGTEAMAKGALYDAFRAAEIGLRPPETQGPTTVGVLFALGAALSAAAIWRSLNDTRHGALWAAGAALSGPVAALLLELFWQPSLTIGAYPWALHVIALSALMTAAAVLFARQDGEDMRRAAYAALATLSLVALALFLILSEAALNVALAVLLATAAALDRRFRLPEMGWFAQAGVLVLGWRLTVDPGVDWAMTAPWAPVVVAFAAAILGMGAALYFFRGLGRTGAQVFLEGGIAAYSAIFANVVITRMIEARIGDSFVGSYWSVALNAMPWLIVALVQLHRMQLPGRFMTIVRVAIAGLSGLIAAAGIGAAAAPLNPLFAWSPEAQGALVYGPLLLDTLLLAYGLPGLLLILAVRRFGHLDRWLRESLTGAGAALAVLYVALEIRRFWQGDFLGADGVTQPELYSYTLALLLTGAALLYQSIARRSAELRWIAMAVIGLTIAKVFLIDASGLSGLTRVFSFLGLGLALAGLAWLNRWAAARQGDGGRGDGGQES